jgi:hypothetical protein
VIVLVGVIERVGVTVFVGVIDGVNVGVTVVVGVIVGVGLGQIGQFSSLHISSINSLGSIIIFGVPPVSSLKP